MRVLSAEKFFQHLSSCPVRHFKLCGLDIGTKRVGLALSDPTRQFVFPLGSVMRKEENRTSLLAVEHFYMQLMNALRSEPVYGFVVGNISYIAVA